MGFGVWGLGRTLEALDRLAVETQDASSPAARRALLKALKVKTNLVVKAAVDIVREHALEGFESPPRSAFELALDEGIKRDPGCRSKEALLRAFAELHLDADDLLLRGLGHVQPEPVWGSTEDTAARLRGRCGMGLVRRHHPEALTGLARLLADPEREARIIAADAVAVSGDVHAGYPLLLFRAEAGESEAEVLTQCYSAMLRLDPPRAFSYLREQLESENSLRAESAALALGQESFQDALPLLQVRSEGVLGDERRVLLMAIAMMRSEAAWTYLLSTIREDGSGRARDAIEALAIYREREGLLARVREAVARRDRAEESLDEFVSESFGDS